MKRILLVLGLVWAFGNMKAQDTVNAQDFTIYTNPSDTDYVWSYNRAADYRLNVTAFMPFRMLGSSGITPKLSTWNLHLGTITPQSTYKLYTIGKGYFSDDLYLNNKLRFVAGGYISYSGNEIMFFDGVTGLITLSDLVGGGGLSSARNGLLINAGYTELGGDLLKNTSIEI